MKDRPYISALTEEDYMPANFYPKKYTSKANLYFSPTYDGNAIKIRGTIMQDAYDAGFNVKSIAWYFKLSLSEVYKRIKVKKSVSLTMSNL